MALFVALWTLILTSIIYMVYGLWLYSVYRKYKSSIFLFLLFVISGPVVGIAVGTPLGKSMMVPDPLFIRHCPMLIQSNPI